MDDGSRAKNGKDGNVCVRADKFTCTREISDKIS